MSIRDRLEDARTLSTAGRQQGAFVAVLVATAATSRKRYPRNEWDDSDSFRNFVYDEMGVITGAAKYGVVLPFLGRQTPLEDILYYHLRCQLLHEGAMPETVEFTEPSVDEDRLSHVLKLGAPLGFPIGWIERLATAVWLAAENDELWLDEVEKRRAAVRQLGQLVFRSPYCRRPGARRRADKGRDEKLEWEHEGQQLRLFFPASLDVSNLPQILEAKACELRR